MSQVWVGLSATAPILIAVIWAVWWLVADGLRERRKVKAAAKFARAYLPELRQRQRVAEVQRANRETAGEASGTVSLTRPYVQHGVRTVVMGTRATSGGRWRRTNDQPDTMA